MQAIPNLYLCTMNMGRHKKAVISKMLSGLYPVHFIARRSNSLGFSVCIKLASPGSVLFINSMKYKKRRHTAHEACPLSSCLGCVSYTR
ncbi:hypothetical protein XENTR_v10008221 [Xenopus tropicalis]|nr:hypothetical protein XENTR_v10008221 [Xenopus tropicalis]